MGFLTGCGNKAEEAIPEDPLDADAKEVSVEEEVSSEEPEVNQVEEAQVLDPDKISLEVGDLASGYSGEVIPADKVAEGDPWFSGEPLRTEFDFDFKVPEGLDFENTVAEKPYLKIYQIEEARAFFEDNSKEGTSKILESNLNLIMKGEPVKVGKLPSPNATQASWKEGEFLETKTLKGIRGVTLYAQEAFDPVDGEIFYTFQGVTQDGEYYITFCWPLLLPTENGYTPQLKDLDALVKSIKIEK
jgi:hypothetical protein